jgi:hypothetical protein
MATRSANIFDKVGRILAFPCKLYAMALLNAE